MHDADPVPADVFRGSDGRLRCDWCRASEAYQRYHDDEWGFPVTDERRLFEKICLEGFQAGLSWLTILNKREAFRRAFANFDAQVLAGFGPVEVERLMADAAIVRHRGKIESAIHNAGRVLALRQEFGSFAAYAWRHEPPPVPRAREAGVIGGVRPTPEAVAMSRDLKRRGWSFVGPTTVYAFMQAMGLVNDHAPDCEAHARAQAARRALVRPA